MPQFIFYSLVSLEYVWWKASASPHKTHATTSEKLVLVICHLTCIRLNDADNNFDGQKTFDINVIYLVKCSACLPTYSQPICLFFWKKKNLCGLPVVVFPFVCFIREHFRSFVVERPIKNCIGLLRQSSSGNCWAWEQERANVSRHIIYVFFATFLNKMKIWFTRH